MKKKEQSSAIIQSLDKGLHLLETIELSNTPITLQQLWVKLKWDKATIYRLLTTLENRGYIHRDESTKGYRLGFKIFGLHNSLVSKLDLQQITKPHLFSLVRKTGESAHLAVPVGTSIVFIDRASGSESLSVSTQIGRQEPMHCTALGKAFLAFIQKEELPKYLGNSLERYTERTIVNKNELKAELKKIREKGYALDNEEYIENIRCIGSPILNQNGLPIAAVGISGPKIRISLKKANEFGVILQKTALEISKFFGYTIE